MSLIQLYVPAEVAHATVEELGEMKCEFFCIPLASNRCDVAGSN